MLDGTAMPRQNAKVFPDREPPHPKMCVACPPMSRINSSCLVYLATREDSLPWLFVSEREAQLTRQAVNYIVRVAGEKAKLGRVWPHMLRHSCGYYLADKGTDLRTMQDYLGHRDPKHTAHYTRVAGHRFEGLWR
jgi:site-specific recombinase XerD